VNSPCGIGLMSASCINRRTAGPRRDTRADRTTRDRCRNVARFFNPPFGVPLPASTWASLMSSLASGPERIGLDVERHGVVSPEIPEALASADNARRHGGCGLSVRRIRGRQSVDEACHRRSTAACSRCPGKMLGHVTCFHVQADPSGRWPSSNIKDAQVEAGRGTPKGGLRIGLHFGIDPGGSIRSGITARPAVLLFDARRAHQADAAGRVHLRPGRAVRDVATPARGLRLRRTEISGWPSLTTADVKWTYETIGGLNFKYLQEKVENIQVVDDRTIIFHFKGPFV